MKFFALILVVAFVGMTHSQETSSPNDPTTVTGSTPTEATTSSSGQSPVKNLVDLFMKQMKGIAEALQNATSAAQKAGLGGPIQSLQPIQQGFQQMTKIMEPLMGQMPSVTTVTDTLKKMATQFTEMGKMAGTARDAFMKAGFGQIGSIFTGIFTGNGASANTMSATAVAAAATDMVQKGADMAANMAKAFNTFLTVAGSLNTLNKYTGGIAAPFMGSIVSTGLSFAGK